MEVMFHCGSKLALFSSGKVLLTGIQSTGDLHIGNYLGSINSILRLHKNQSFHQQYFMVADYHALTTAISNQHGSISLNQSIAKDTISMTKVLLASGVNPQNMCLFVQSQVPQHCQLTWILSCLGPQFWLNTMIQYKQKSHQNSSVGLYTYPILMAVDILLYKANIVPVGVDQLQHIELTNKYAQRFNKLTKSKFFPKVQYIQSKYPKIMSLVDPNKKMSKSDQNHRSRILLTDKPQQIKEKIRRAVTDSNGNHLSYDPHSRPGLSNLIQIYSAFTEKDIDSVVSEFQTDKTTIGQFKQRLTSVLSERLEDIQDRVDGISDEQVRQVLLRGQDKARKVASEHIRQIKQLLNIYT